ncbi:MAG TPA: formylglycine-generating enzyme family protein [Gemmatimonadaceae bacterium]|jgi:formylglycine-generating enzyme required for sulfatase activity
MRISLFVAVAVVAYGALASRGDAQQARAASGRAPGATFRDCDDCPEMVVVGAGHFVMGSSSEEKTWAASHGGNLASVADEAPQHDVRIKSFAIGKFPVTRGEYALFARATGHAYADGCGYDGAKWDKRPTATWESPGYAQTDRDPVVCVSWNDARAYVDWLNTKFRRESVNDGSGPYRLPTEAEWEYAARAGTTTRFWWGDAEEAANYAWYASNAGGATHAVGTRTANPFGLFDMSGNVWQWTQDCYEDSYAGAPSDGASVERPAPCLRVDRGGSWHQPAWLLRPAARERNPEDYRYAMLGFRVARSER